MLGIIKIWIWGRKFKKYSAFEQFKKCQEEVREAYLDNKNWEELADVFIATNLLYTKSSLFRAIVREKMKINKARKWVRKNGVAHHIERD